MYCVFLTGCCWRLKLSDRWCPHDEGCKAIVNQSQLQPLRYHAWDTLEKRQH